MLADGFAAEVRQLTDGRGVDVIVDPVGGERFTDSLRSLAREGRLLVVGFAGGEIPVIKTNRLLLTNTTVMGAATRELWNHEPEMPRWQWNELMPLLKSGVLDPVIGAQFSIEQTGSAIRMIDERRAAGKFSCVFGSASTRPTRSHEPFGVPADVVLHGFSPTDRYSPTGRARCRLSLDSFDAD